MCGRWRLLYLRLAALAALLFLVLLQPMFAWTKTWEEPGRVLVAVDRSGSMDVPDPQRKPVDKLRLARALHLNHNACTETAAMAGLGLSAARAAPDSRRLHRRPARPVDTRLPRSE